MENFMKENNLIKIKSNFSGNIKTIDKIKKNNFIKFLNF